MELNKVRYNLYNYLIKDKFDYSDNKDYLILWKYTLIILFIFIAFIIIAHYKQLDLYGIFIIILIILFIYIIYFEMETHINNIESNKYLFDYKNYYEYSTILFIENFDFTEEDETNNKIYEKNKKYKTGGDLQLDSDATLIESLIHDNKDTYNAYIKYDNNCNLNYLYIKTDKKLSVELKEFDNAGLSNILTTNDVLNTDSIIYNNLYYNQNYFNEKYAIVNERKEEIVDDNNDYKNDYLRIKLDWNDNYHKMIVKLNYYFPLNSFYTIESQSPTINYLKFVNINYNLIQLNLDSFISDNRNLIKNSLIFNNLTTDLNENIFTIKKINNINYYLLQFNLNHLNFKEKYNYLIKILHNTNFTTYRSFNTVMGRQFFTKNNLLFTFTETIGDTPSNIKIFLNNLGLSSVSTNDKDNIMKNYYGTQMVTDTNINQFINTLDLDFNFNIKVFIKIEGANSLFNITQKNTLLSNLIDGFFNYYENLVSKTRNIINITNIDNKIQYLLIKYSELEQNKNNNFISLILNEILSQNKSYIKLFKNRLNKDNRKEGTNTIITTQEEKTQIIDEAQKIINIFDKNTLLYKNLKNNFNHDNKYYSIFNYNNKDYLTINLDFNFDVFKDFIRNNSYNITKEDIYYKINDVNVFNQNTDKNFTDNRDYFRDMKTFTGLMSLSDSINPKIIEIKNIPTYKYITKILNEKFLILTYDIKHFSILRKKEYLIRLINSYQSTTTYIDPNIDPIKNVLVYLITRQGENINIPIHFYEYLGFVPSNRNTGPSITKFENLNIDDKNYNEEINKLNLNYTIKFLIQIPPYNNKDLDSTLLSTLDYSKFIKNSIIETFTSDTLIYSAQTPVSQIPISDIPISNIPVITETPIPVYSDYYFILTDKYELLRILIEGFLDYFKYSFIENKILKLGSEQKKYLLLDLDEINIIKDETNINYILSTILSAEKIQIENIVIANSIRYQNDFYLEKNISDIDLYIKIDDGLHLNPTFLNKYPYINSYVKRLLKIINENLIIDKKTNRFMQLIGITPEDNILFEYLTRYLNIKQKIKRSIKYINDKTDEEINNESYIQLINDRSVLKYIDIYTDKDFLYIKDFLFVRSHGNDEFHYKYLKDYTPNESVLMNDKEEPELNIKDIIRKINYPGNPDIYNYYLVNLKNISKIKDTYKFDFMNEFIKHLNKKYETDIKSLDILFKPIDQHLNKNILKIIETFNYIYIKIIIVAITLITIILHAFYIDYIRYFR